MADKLINFLLDVEGTIDSVIETPEILTGPRREALQDFARVWFELDAGTLIREQQTPLYDAERTGLLSALGLRGDALDFKLSQFHRCRTGYYSNPSRRSRRRSVLKWLLWALRWADTILGSLVMALPGIDPFREMKEALENLVEEELDPPEEENEE